MITIVGIEYRKYKSKKTGKDVEGYNIHVTDDTPWKTWKVFLVILSGLVLACSLTWG